MKNITVAVDGPVAAGKSSITKIVAKNLGLDYIDTGAMYRSVAYYAIENNVDVNNEEEISKLAKSISIKFVNNRLIANGKDITDEIRQDKISNMTATIASYKDVRVHIVKLQQDMINDGGIIMDGRDIGSIVMPNADVKIYLTASIDSRAKRRFEDNKKRGILESTLEEIKAEIEDRDHKDMTRPVSPLVQVADAIVIDTSDLTFEESIDAMTNAIKNK